MGRIFTSFTAAVGSVTTFFPEIMEPFFGYSFFVKPGFDLTFQKWFVTFPMKITAKLILNLVHHGWWMKNILKSMRLYSTTNNCVKNHLKVNYVIFLIHTEKDHLCFYKNSNQTFAIISKEVVYFKKRLAYHVEHP